MGPCRDRSALPAAQSDGPPDGLCARDQGLDAACDRGVVLIEDVYEGLGVPVDAQRELGEVVAPDGEAVEAFGEWGAP